MAKVFVCSGLTIIRMGEEMNQQQMLWAIARMGNLFRIWDSKLDRADKEYCLRRIRDKEPKLFWSIVREAGCWGCHD